MILFSFLLYFLLGIVQAEIELNGNGAIQFIKTTFTLKNILKLLLLNIPMINIPTWFLLAQLYSYIIIYIIRSAFLNYKWVPYAFASFIIFLALFRLIVETKNLSLLGNDLSSPVLYMNWFVNGLPLISLGIVLKKHEKSISKIPPKILLFAYITSFILMTLEAYLLYTFFHMHTRIFLFNIVNAVIIMCFSVTKPYLFSNSKFLNQSGNFKMYVYILHPAIIMLMNLIIEKMGFSVHQAFLWIRPIIVLLVTLTISIAVNYFIIKTQKKHTIKKRDTTE